MSLDTLRADHLGAYGYARKVSPNLDRLAGEGVLFERVYAPMGTTSPSHATLFTSQSTLAHGLMRNGLSLASGHLTLAERLQGAGYRCAAFVSSYPLKARFGFGQGFDHYDDEFSIVGTSFVKSKWEGQEVEGGFDRTGEMTRKATAAWLESQDPSVPLFLWVHLFDPHAPYSAPEKYASRWTRERASEEEQDINAYDGEIHYVDAVAGALLEDFDRWTKGASTLVVVIGDHGEGLYDHGYRAHNRYLYDEETRVPWLMRWKGTIPAGLRSTYPSHLIDVAPTLLSMLDAADAMDGLNGLDLSGLVVAGSRRPVPPAAKDRPLWLQRPYYPLGRVRFEELGYGFGVRVGDWKLIEAQEEGQRELYNLASDPGEQKNLAEVHPEMAAGLSQRIADWVERDRPKGRPPQLDIREEDRAALQALGYEEVETQENHGPSSQ